MKINFEKHRILMQMKYRNNISISVLITGGGGITMLIIIFVYPLYCKWILLLELGKDSVSAGSWTGEDLNKISKFKIKY